MAGDQTIDLMYTKTTSINILISEEMKAEDANVDSIVIDLNRLVLFSKNNIDNKDIANVVFPSSWYRYWFLCITLSNNINFTSHTCIVTIPTTMKDALILLFWLDEVATIYNIYRSNSFDKLCAAAKKVEVFTKWHFLEIHHYQVLRSDLSSSFYKPLFIIL
jgi:hypothetical protein